MMKAVSHSQDVNYSPGFVPVGADAVLADEQEIPFAYAGLRLDAALARLFPQHSRSRLQAWLKSGALRITPTATHPAHKVRGGEHVRLHLPDLPDARAPQAQEIALAIVYEDDTLLVIDKPAGLVVHPGAGNAAGTLLNALLHHHPAAQGLPRAGIVHRLDKDTSGLLVVAKTLAAQTDLVRQLQARSVARHYLALVHGVVKADGVVDAPIARHPVQRTKMAVAPAGRGRLARTHYRVCERFAAASLLECKLDTGRTHQIRVHLSALGHPLLGDGVYGRQRACANLPDCPRQALHAWRLALRHPQRGSTLAWEVPLPPDFLAVLTALRETATLPQGKKDD